MPEYHLNHQADTDIGTVSTITAAGAGSVTGPDLDTHQHRGIAVFVNITAISGTSPTLTVTIKGKSPAGVDYTILASAALTATGQTVLKVYPALTAAANLTANDVVPCVTHVDYTIGGTGPSVTGTISAVLLY